MNKRKYVVFLLVAFLFVFGSGFFPRNTEKIAVFKTVTYKKTFDAVIDALLDREVVFHRVQRPKGEIEFLVPNGEWCILSKASIQDVSPDAKVALFFNTAFHKDALGLNLNLDRDAEEILDQISVLLDTDAVLIQEEKPSINYSSELNTKGDIW